MTTPTPSPSQPPAATTAFAGGRALVLALYPEDAVFGCAGAILRHSGGGDAVRLAVLADAPGADPAPSGAPPAGLDALRRAAALLGGAEPEFWALPPAAVHGLMRCCDAFVSLHRSEGFGRGPAEAMYFGKPVIVTGYSGNLDFCHDQNACVVDHTLVAVEEGEYPQGAGQIWAEPDVEQAAWFMRRLVDDPAFARRIGAAGAAYVREFNSYAAVGRRYARRLRQLDLV